MNRRRFVWVLLIVAPLTGVAQADPGELPLLSVRGVRVADYSLDSGTVEPEGYGGRIGRPIWEATTPSGYYFGAMAWDTSGMLCLDWGDIAPAVAGGFSFSYGTEVVDPLAVTCRIIFYGNDDGWNSTDRTAIAGFTLTDLPAADPNGAYNTWIINVPLDWLEFSGVPDVDGDGLGDFSYTYWFPGMIGTHTGPVIAGDPNTPGQGAGMEDAFDGFVPVDPGDPNTDFDYYATLWFGAVPFAQFYMVVREMEPFLHCPYEGEHGGFCTDDIAEPYDCVVGLEDLAVLLTNYGTTSGATHDEGDLEGYDGDVDLADLAHLLAHYGDDCNE